MCVCLLVLVYVPIVNQTCVQNCCCVVSLYAHICVDCVNSFMFGCVCVRSCVCVVMWACLCVRDHVCAVCVHIVNVCVTYACVCYCGHVCKHLYVWCKCVVYASVCEYVRVLWFVCGCAHMM